MKRISISKLSVVMALLLGQNANASELRSDVFFVVPKAFIRNSATEFKGTFSHSAGNLAIPGQFPATTTNFATSFDYQISNLNPLAMGHFDAGVTLSNFRITMDSFHVDQMIEQVINGVIVRIHIKIDCNGMVVAARRPFDVTGTAQIRNPLGMTLNTLVIPTDTTLWSVTAASCTPADSLTFLEEEINKSFANSSEVRDYVVSQVNQNLATWFAGNKTFQQALPAFGARIEVQAQEFIDNAESWIVRMPSKLTTTANCPTMNRMGVIPGVVPSATPATEVMFQASEKILTVLGKCAHETGIFNRTDSTNDIPAFAELMGNSVVKGVVWPDLNRFPANAEFALHTKTSGVIFDLIPTVGGGNPNSVYYNLSANMLTRMRYIRRGVEENYVQFYTPLGGTIEAAGQAVGWDQPSTLKFQFYGAPTLNLQYVFQVPRSQVPNPKIDVALVQPELLNAVQGKSFSFAVNPFPLSTTRQIQFFGLGRDGTNLQMKLGIAKKP